MHQSVLLSILVATSFLSLSSGIRFFDDPNLPFYQDISQAPLHPNSNNIINYLQGQNWGAGRFQIDRSIHVLTADSNTPRVTWTKKSDYYDEPCDNLVEVPLPVGGALEGCNDYFCSSCSGSSSDGDCHLIVYDVDEKKLYESYRTTVRNVGGVTVVSSTCTVVWDLCQTYPLSLRGDQCTSADAAGFPIAQLLFYPEEVFAGNIDHAIRFILRNPTMRAGFYVRPASHAGGPSSSNQFAPIYGVRFRLKASFDEIPYNQYERVVIQALKKYGMFLSDGGNIPITSASDLGSSVTWDSMGFGTRVLQAIRPDDFEVLDYGQPIVLTYNCVLNVFPPNQCSVTDIPTPAPTTPPPPPTVAPTTAPPPTQTLKMETITDWYQNTWTTVPVSNTYTNMVVACTPHYISGVPRVVRVQITNQGYLQIKLQAPDNQAFSATKVTCIVVEEGVYTEAVHGIKMEATVVPVSTTARFRDWSQRDLFTPSQSYNDPVVLGQVMSENDAKWSVFWASGSTYSQPPSPSSIYIGKHIGEDPILSRATESVGVIIVEAGSGSIQIGSATHTFDAKTSSRSIRGFGDSPPYNIPVSVSSPRVVVASSLGMRGNNGGWPIVYGSGSSTNIGSAIEEDTLRDSERRHTTETLGVFVVSS